MKYILEWFLIGIFYKMKLNNLSIQYFKSVEVLHSERTFKTNVGYYNKHIKDTLGLKNLKKII